MNVFNKIDNYFYERDKKDFFYTILAVVSLVGFIIYYFVYPMVSEYEKVQEEKYIKLTRKYKNTKNSIRALETRISILKRKIKKEENKVAILKKQKMFYTELANVLDFAEFDQYKWANLVKETVIDAKNKGLEVVKVENQIYDINTTKIDNKKNKTKKITNMPEIVKRMDIGIELEGKYRNFIDYLYKYENRKELIRVREMNLKAPSTFYIKFSIYGYDQ
jgi:hypothetical protein